MPLSNVGPYRLLHLLKSGGEGSVYEAQDTRLGRRVALKLRPLPGELAARAAAIVEAETLASLDHPLIVRLYDLVELPDALALVMEFIDGEDLESLLGLGRLDLNAILQIGMDICTALDAAHERGIVHGDLKPSNILVDSRGQIKLVDFGIARRVGGATGRGGSLAVLAPEQLAGEPPDARTDLFALGCLLYRLTVGEQPFAASDFRDGVRAIPRRLGAASVEALYAVNPQALADLVERLLQHQKTDRPGSALQVRQDLLTISRDFPAGSSAALAGLVQDVRHRSTVAPSLQSLARPQADSRTKSPWSGAGAVMIRRAAVIGAVLMAVILLWRAVVSMTVAPLDLVLDPPEITGHRATAALTPEEFLNLLRAELRRRQGINVLLGVTGSTGPSASVERLQLSVHCNPYACSSRLVRLGAGGANANLMTMLPDAPVADWQQRIAQGVQALFPAVGDAALSQ